MLPKRAAEALDRIWPVFLWKWELDKGTKWYRRFFFWYIYRPFIHFAWKVFKVPAANGIEVDGNKYRVVWFENMGFFSSEDQADIACTTEWHGYKDVPLDRRFPDESCQYSSLVFPRQKDPRQHRRRPTFSIVATPRSELDQLKEEVAKLREELHQAHR